MDEDYTQGPEDVTATSATIASLADDTAYQVQVRASNADGEGEWSDPGAGRTINTAPGTMSIERQDPAVRLTNADTLTWRVTFTEDVTDIDGADFTVSGATATLAVTKVPDTTGAYDVTASGGDLGGLDGTVTFGFSQTQDITDRSGGALASTEPTGANETTYELDNTAPAFVSAALEGTLLTLSYDEALDEESSPAPGAYTIGIGDMAGPPESVAVSDAQVMLTIGEEPPDEDSVSVSYTVPATGPVRDAAGNEVATLSGEEVERSLIRLVGGSGEHEGRVEVFHSGEWGTVCDDYWDKRDADVACRMAEYQAGSVEDAGQFVRAHFGKGELERLWLDNLRCRGDEEDLFECHRARNLAIGEHNCRQRESVGVRCLVTGSTAPPRIKQIRIGDAPGGRWNRGEAVEVTLVWTEAVNVGTAGGGDPPKLWIGLEASNGQTQVAVVRKAVYASGSGTAETAFRYTVKDKDRWDPGRAPDYGSAQVFRNSLRLRDGAIRSAGGAEAEIEHPGHPRTAPQLQAPEVETQPTISGPGPDGRWTPGETVEVGIAFDRQVLVTTTGGTPSVEIGFLDGTRHRAPYTFGSRTHELIFTYTLSEEDGTKSAVLVTRDSLSTGGGQIRGYPDLAAAALGHESAARQGGPAEVEPTGPSAAFSDVPEEHDGRTAFTLRFTMSEAPKAGFSFRTVRDHLFDVSGGRIGRAKRATPGEDQAWNLTVHPGTKGDITVTMRETRSCDASPRVCTADGRPLAGDVSVTIPGPAELRVADAEAQEGPGAVLEFRVTLSRSRSEATKVDYATSDDTATADEDYAPTRGTLTFEPGVTERIVAVRILDDTHDEGEETMTLTLSNPVPGAYVRIGDGTATGTISNDDPMPKAWTVRFGRTVGSQVVDALTRRLATGDGSHVTVGGVRLRAGGTPEEEPREGRTLKLPEWDERTRLEARTRSMTMDELVRGSAFHLSAGGEHPGTTQFSAWGHFVTGGFETEQDHVTLDGEVTTGLFGADAKWDRFLAGIMLSQSSGDGSYRLDESRGDDEGKVGSTMAGMYPYLEARLNERVSAWGLVGFGRGDLTLTRENETLRTDLDMRMGAVGIRGRVLDGSGASGIGLDLKSDAMWVQTSTDRTEGMMESEGDVSRVRLILEGERPFATEGGGMFTPSAELGLRVDGGDAETGAGLELGAGLRYLSGAVSVEGRVRGLVAHEESGYEEWGASGTVRVSPGQSGRGLTLSLTPVWGNAGSQAERLWGARDASGLEPGGEFRARARLETEVGYGLTGPRGVAVVTPYTGLSLAEDAGRTLRTGARWNLFEGAVMGLEGTRQAGRNGERGTNAVEFRTEIRW